MLVGDDSISAILRRHRTLATGFSFRENPGSSVRRGSSCCGTPRLASAEHRRPACVQVLRVIKTDGQEMTGMKAWRYVLRKFGIERPDSELDVMLIDGGVAPE